MRNRRLVFCKTSNERNRVSAADPKKKEPYSIFDRINVLYKSGGTCGSLPHPRSYLEL